MNYRQLQTEPTHQFRRHLPVIVRQVQPLPAGPAGYPTGTGRSCWTSETDGALGPSHQGALAQVNPAGHGSLRASVPGTPDHLLPFGSDGAGFTPAGAGQALCLRQGPGGPSSREAPRHGARRAGCVRPWAFGPGRRRDLWVPAGRRAWVCPWQWIFIIWSRALATSISICVVCSGETGSCATSCREQVGSVVQQGREVELHPPPLGDVVRPGVAACSRAPIS